MDLKELNIMKGSSPLMPKLILTEFSLMTEKKKDPFNVESYKTWA